MFKLYKKIKNNIHYFEIWNTGKRTGLIHWGIIGKQGKNEQLKVSIFSSVNKKIKKIVDKKLSDGYNFVPLEKHKILLIEYPVKDMGNENDIAKARKLRDKMNELLGWTGLGFCDGWSMGQGTMEVCCYVVDFKIAKTIVSDFLAKETEFTDYKRIYEEK